MLTVSKSPAHEIDVRILETTTHECDDGSSHHKVFFVTTKHKHLRIGVTQALMNAMHKYMRGVSETAITQAALITITTLMHEEPLLFEKLQKDGFAAFGSYNVALIH